MEAIKIIDYKAGNAPSVMHAVTHLGHQAQFARCPADLEKATHIILPGVGSAKATMDSLCEIDILAALEESVLQSSICFLGICVGMQVLFEHSEEEDAQCLGWLGGQVVKYDANKVRVPQMGWNKVSFIQDTPCKAEDDYFYFVNSYYAKPEKESDIWGIADYNGTFTAAIRRKNIYGTQFHVEKSGEVGLRLLNNFLCMRW
jgi:glutamine amidotransferase